MPDPTGLLKTLVEERRSTRAPPSPHAMAMDAAAAALASQGKPHVTDRDAPLRTALRVEKSFDKGTLWWLGCRVLVCGTLCVPDCWIISDGTVT